MTAPIPSEDDFLGEIDRVLQRQPNLSPLQAALLMAAHLGVASDSRTFSNKVGVAHALALRELNALAETSEFLHISKRDARTLRTHYVLSVQARTLLQPVISADVEMAV